ncbi:hypothetical protein HZS38_00450 [Xenorhabdus nematophila]|uniref:Uncharacterized protein n=1 Tax=Xenorhabdus nematophila (strain ATCC 19061 / DSM 3370 / CCUG 14189 / LMG 1036 / NCIMB 9965 / AN6) TaxID=406817 RepID=D3VJ80_XENNA|nr:hypothetical protein D3790_00585 [Xenorhabdus nematophila]MBA0017762.1 hypothetical protein [Xenorhabdus nematophila]MCB4426972.1 hypothetical protein [Xenorhabdus nematophila]QNJ38259.1 hypothetical protein H8F46_00565 [Xenorhabdus nematophila]CBJ90937.1 hypothetical protein XNC1_2883 [Xenorhabdus nematophila ATCC 19061]
MTVKELRKNLTYLVDKYIPDNERKKELYIYIQQENIPVKGILTDFNKFGVKSVTQDDGKLISDIYFHYC